MDQALQRGFHAGQRIACFQERHVERLSVEGDEAIAICQRLGERLEQRFLLRIVTQEELPNHKLHPFHISNADKECAGARPPGEARGFRVEENQPRGIGHRRVLQQQV